MIRHLLPPLLALATTLSARADWLTDPVRQWNTGFAIGETLASDDVLLFLDQDAGRLFRFKPSSGEMKSTALMGKPAPAAPMTVPGGTVKKLLVPLSNRDAVQVLHLETLETLDVLHIGFPPQALASDFAPAYSDPESFFAVDGSSAASPRVRRVSLTDGSVLGGLPDTRLNSGILIGAFGDRLFGVRSGSSDGAPALIEYRKNALQNIVRTGEWFPGRDNEIDFDVHGPKVFLVSRNRHDLRVRDTSVTENAETIWPMGGTSVAAVAVKDDDVWAATGDESNGHITKFPMKVGADGKVEPPVTRYITGVFSGGLLTGRLQNRSLQILDDTGPVFVKRSGSTDRLCWIGGKPGPDPLLTTPTQDAIDLGRPRTVLAGQGFRLNPSTTGLSPATHAWASDGNKATFSSTTEPNPRISFLDEGVQRVTVVRTARHSPFFTTKATDNVSVTVQATGFANAMKTAGLQGAYFEGDADADGLTNLLEYALGGDVLKPAHHPPLLTLTAQNVDGVSHPALSYRRLKTDDMLSVALEFSVDCQVWQPAGGPPFETLPEKTSQPAGQMYENVNVALQAPSPAKRALFARIRAFYTAR